VHALARQLRSCLVRLKRALAAQVGGNFFESCDEVVAHAGAGGSTRFDTHARLTLMSSIYKNHTTPFSRSFAIAIGS
jgi:hypothetical protein